MNIKWQIPFVSLSGTAYTINVYDANYSGSPIILEGGAQPFTTDEDGDDEGGDEEGGGDGGDEDGGDEEGGDEDGGEEEGGEE